MKTYTQHEVLCYFTDIKKYHNFNWTADEFKMFFEDEGFTRDEETRLFTHPNPDIMKGVVL